MNCCILIPAYRPDEKLLHLLESLQASGLHEILIVNDGSGPDCDEIFSGIQTRWSHVKILSHDVNRGKGSSLKTGFQYLLDHAPDSIAGAVTADADGSLSRPCRKMLRDCLSRSLSLTCR